MPGAYDYSRSFFRRFYTPDDCTLFVVGDFDAAKVSELVRAEYSGWTGRRAESRVAVEPEQTAPRAQALTWRNATAPRLIEGFRVPAAAELRDTAALAVAGSIVLGASSDIYQRLVVKEQKVIELSFDPDDALSRDPGLLSFDAKLKPSTSFDEVIGAVDDAFAEVGRGRVPAEKIDAVRRHLTNAVVLRLDTPVEVGIELARWTALTGDTGSLQAYVDALGAVTAEDVARVSRTYLVPAHRNVVTLTAAGPATPSGAHAKGATR
jgi:zinc protease